MPKNPLIQVALNQARFARRELQNVKERLNDDLYNVVLMRNFFTTFFNTYDPERDGTPNSTIDEAVSAAEQTLPQDNPNTARDEGISLDEFWDIVNEFYEDAAIDGINLEEAGQLDPEQINTELGDTLNELGRQIRRIIGQQMDFNAQIDDKDREIDDLSNLAKTDGQPIA